MVRPLPGRVRVHFCGGIELDDSDLSGHPIGPPADPRSVVVVADGNVSDGWPQNIDRSADLTQQPGSPDRRVTGERRFLRGEEDTDLASPDVIHEDGLGEPELDGHCLATFGGDCAAIEEDPKGIAAPAIRTHEDTKDMKCCHSTSRQHRST